MSESYRSAERYSRWAVGLLSVQAALHLGKILLGLLLLSHVDSTLGTVEPSDEVVSLATRYDDVSLLQWVLFVAGVIAFLRWMHRYIANVRALSPGSLSYSTAEAMWSWFLPFLNFYRPYQVFRAAEAASRSPEDSYLRPSFLGWWWGLWIASRIAQSVAARLGGEDLGAALQLDAVASLLTIVAALLAVKMIRYMQGLQRGLAGEVETTRKPAEF